MISNVYAALKEDSVFVLNFGDILDLPAISGNIAEEEGFVLEDTLYSTPPGMFQRSSSYREHYLVLRKRRL